MASMGTIGIRVQRAEPRAVNVKIDKVEHVSITQVESTPDAELRAAAEALLMGGVDTVGDVFVRNLVAVHRPAFRRLADALGIDLDDIPALRYKGG